MRYLFPLLIAAAPAWAQDHSACYPEGAAPSGVLEATQEEWVDLLSPSFGYSVIPLAYRRLCGFEDEQNEAYAKAVLDQVGCRVTSTVGTEYLSYLKMDVGELSHSLVGCDLRAAAPQEDWTTFCTQVAKLEIAELANPDLDDESDTALAMRNAYEVFDILIEKVTEKGC